MKTIIKETAETNFVKLCEWCREYHKFNLYPTGTERRFIIGTYQIAQAIEWENAAKKSGRINFDFESFAAGALHFIMVAESMDLGLESLPIFAKILPHDIKDWHRESIDYRLYTLWHGQAAQMLIYGLRSKDLKKYSRGSRWDPIKMAHAIAGLVSSLLCHIPGDKRSEAIEQASSIMTKRL